MTAAAVSSTVMVPQGRGGLVAHLASGTATTAAFEKGDSPSFSDLIDIINPLQHIPVINTVYRAITGDHEGAVADVIGGALYGGPIGAGLAIADLGLRDTTGGTVGEHAMASLGFGTIEKPKASDTAVAQAAQPAAQVAAATAATPAPAAPMLKPAAASTDAPAAKAAAQKAANAPTLTPASMTPTTLAMGETATPAAAATMLQPPSPYAAPREPVTPDGPVTAGAYLVFGGAGAAGPSTTGETVAKPEASAAPATPKTFATLGGSTPPATSLPDATAAAAKTASAAADKPRVFRVPPRNGPAAPPANLPPPTTGPGALPGGKSMALTAQEAQMAAVQNDPQHNFLTAYTQALDKYRNAQRLAAQNAGAGDQASPTPLVPAAAEVPADAVTGTSAVVLH